MQFSILAASLFTAVAMAIPYPILAADLRGLAERQTYTPCSGLYSVADCCATDVLGVADLDCAVVSSTPTDADDYSAICAAIGQRARCCVLDLLGQGVLCETPTGVTD